MRRRRRGRCRRVAPPPLVERPPHAQNRKSPDGVACRRSAAARVTGARRVPGRAVPAGCPRRHRFAVVIHGGTIRRHTRQHPRQTLTQVVNRHDRPSPSFGRTSVAGASMDARRCTGLHILAACRGHPRGRRTDTLRHRTRRRTRTRDRAVSRFDMRLTGSVCSIATRCLLAAVPSGTAAGRPLDVRTCCSRRWARRGARTGRLPRASRGGRSSSCGRRDRRRRWPGRRPTATPSGRGWRRRWPTGGRRRSSGPGRRPGRRSAA